MQEKLEKYLIEMRNHLFNPYMNTNGLTLDLQESGYVRSLSS